MKKITLKPAIIFFLGAVLLSSCSSLSKMKNNASKIAYNVTPEVLEAHGGNVEVAIEGRVPGKYFLKDITMEATPVLKYEGGEAAYEPYTLQGESVDGNATVISYASGGSFSYSGSVPFVDGMHDSDLELHIVAKSGKKTEKFPPLKIADGVIVTSTLFENSPTPMEGIQKEENMTGIYDPTIDAFQRIVPDSYKADLMYLINSSYVRGREVKKEEMTQLNKYIKDAFEAERTELKGVEVLAYASPDGELDFNDNLSQKREVSAANAVSKSIQRSKVDVELTSKYTPEDWEGFKTLVEQSAIQDKELILRVLSMHTDPEVREREIRNLSEAFTALADDILPKLRRAKITANIEVIGKTDNEITELANSDPSQLNQAELLYAAKLTEDLEKKKAIYSSFISAYSDDWRGYNNLGLIFFKQDDLSNATSLFEKADELSQGNPVVKNNLGAVALKNNDLKKAEELLGGASGAGEAVDQNMGLVSYMKADYNTSANYYGDIESVNSALAQMMKGNNNEALKILNNIEEETANVSYLKAVIGARTAKASLLYENLKTAVAKDSSLKETAKKDLEFAKYLEEADFKSIVE